MIKIVLLLAAAVLLSSMIVIYFGCIFRRYKVVEHKDIRGDSYFKLYKKGFFSYKPFYIPTKAMTKNDYKEEGAYLFPGVIDIYRKFTRIDKHFYSIDDALRACAHCAHGKMKYKGCDIIPVISDGDGYGNNDVGKELFACSMYITSIGETIIGVGTKDSCKEYIDSWTKEEDIASRCLKFRKETVVKLGLKQRIKDFISK